MLTLDRLPASHATRVFFISSDFGTVWLRPCRRKPFWCQDLAPGILPLAPGFGPRFSEFGPWFGTWVLKCGPGPVLLLNFHLTMPLLLLHLRIKLQAGPHAMCTYGPQSTGYLAGTCHACTTATASLTSSTGHYRITHYTRLH